MARTKSRGFAPTKRSRKGQAKAAQKAMDMAADSNAFDGTIKQAGGEPGLNDWTIVSLEKKKGSEEDEEEAHAEVLAGVMEMMAELIVVGNYGAFSTEDDDGFYIVKFTSIAYTLQADVDLEEYTPAMRIKAGELVCDAEYFNTSGWYTPTQGEGRKTKVRVQQVLAANLNLAPISESNKLPAGMNKKKKSEATKLKALHLDQHEHDLILDESALREMLEHDEEIDDGEYEDEMEGEDDESEGEEADGEDGE